MNSIFRARYISLDGTEGVGKSTQVTKIANKLKEKGYKVLVTKEPGTSLLPLTMELRKIMLDNDYDQHLTPTAREFVSQAIRSIHIDKLIIPSLHEYDYIIQDRGMLSGLAYGAACGNDIKFLRRAANKVTENIADFYGDVYDDVVVLTNNIEKGLDRALSSKKEFESGDAMESRGSDFLHSVFVHMKQEASNFTTTWIEVDDLCIDDVFHLIWDKLNLP